MSIQYWHNSEKPKDRFIAFEGAYHGDTFGSMCLTEVGSMNLLKDLCLMLILSLDLI